MKQVFTALAVATIGTTGCASIPSLPGKHQVRIADVIHAMKCEIAHAQVPRNKEEQKLGMEEWLSKRKYTTTLKLIVTDNNSFSGDVSLGIPVSVGSTSIGLTGGLALSDSRTVKLAIHGDFATTYCDDNDIASRGQDWRLGGTIGLESWLKKLRKETLALETGELGTFDHNLLFTIKPSHSLKPRFTLIPAGLTSAGLNPAWTSFREDKHSIDIQITKKVPRTVAPGSVIGKPLYVAVTNQPDGADTAKFREALLAYLKTLQDQQRSLAARRESFAADTDPATIARQQRVEAENRLLIERTEQAIRDLPTTTRRVRLRGRRPDPSRAARERILQQRFDEQQQNISRQNDQLDQLGIE